MGRDKNDVKGNPMISSGLYLLKHKDLDVAMVQIDRASGRTSAGCGRGRRQDCGLVGIPCRTGYPQRHPAGAELSAGGNESFSDAVSLWTEPYGPLLDAAHRGRTVLERPEFL